MEAFNITMDGTAQQLSATKDTKCRSIIIQNAATNIIYVGSAGAQLFEIGTTAGLNWMRFYVSSTRNLWIKGTDTEVAIVIVEE